MLPPPPPFRPLPLLGGPRAQTLLGALPRPGLSGFAHRAFERRFRLPDGGRLIAREHRRGGRPLVVILHGLTGDSEAGYALGLARALFDAGFDALRLNARGALGSEAESGGLHHAARSDDLLEVLRQLEGEAPALYVAGFSLGGSIALRMISQAAERLPVRLGGLFAVSPPLDLAACAERLRHGGFNRILTGRFLRAFARSLGRQPNLPALDIRPAEVAGLGSVLEFDRRVTAPANGYPSVEAYYRDASPLTHIAGARLPGLILHALDDPLVDPAGLEDPRLLARANLVIEALPRGGHVGFVAAGRIRARRRYAETRALAWFNALEARRPG